MGWSAMLLWKHRTVLLLVALLVGVPIGASAVAPGDPSEVRGDAAADPGQDDASPEQTPTPLVEDVAPVPEVRMEPGAASRLPTSLPLLVTDGVEGGPRSRLMLGPALEERIDARILDVQGLVDEGHVDDKGRIRVVVSADATARALLAVGPLVMEPRELSGLGLLLGHIAIDDLPNILAVPGVERVDHDGVAELHLAESVPLIRADQVHQRVDPDGEPVRGTGIKIAILDTGIDYTHPHLGGCFGTGCKVVSGHDYVNDDIDPFDDHGHGTHVAAIAAGSKGVAPGATIVAMKVCTADGACPESAILAALDDLLGSDVDVLSMSLGSRYQCLGCALSKAVEWHLSQRIVVASAGNRGPGLATVGTPAATPGVLAVGASDKLDRLADFSARGPVYDMNQVHSIKPDLVAPGVAIKAAVPTGSCTLCDPSGEATLSGTSMAAPHVSGTAALLIQEHPGWSLADIRLAITNGAVPLGEAALAEGTGRVDALSATTMQVTLSPHNAFSGFVAANSGTFTFERTLTLKNLQGASRSVTLGGSAAGWSTSIEPSSVTLAAGESRTVALTLSGDTAGLGAGWHDGSVTATSGGVEAVTRHSILHQPVIHFRLDGGRAAGLWDHDRNTMFALPSGSDFDFAWRHGRYSVPVTYSCDWSAPVCQYEVVFVENFTLHDESWVNTTRADAVHPITAYVEAIDGTWHEPMGMAMCGPDWSNETCRLTNELSLQPLARSYTLGVLGFGYRPVQIATSNVSDGWILGWGTGIQTDHDTQFYGNRTFGVTGPTNFTHTRDDLANLTFEYRMTRGWSEGVRWMSCIGNGQSRGFTDPRVRPIFEGERETIHMALEGEVWMSPCGTVFAEIRGGQGSGWYDCSDPLGCAVAASAPYLRRSGNVIDASPLVGPDVPLPMTDAMHDGALIVTDGAPTFAGHLNYRGSFLWVEGAPRGYWMSGSGGKGFLHETHQTYRFQNDGETVKSGNGPYILVTHHPGWTEEVTFRADHHETYMDGVTCAARYVNVHERGLSDRLFPGVAWARVIGPDGLGTRFAANDPLELRLGIYNPGADLLTFNVTLLRGTEVVGQWIDPAPLPDGTYAWSVPSDIAGAYRLVVTITTDDGESVLLRQDPAYIIGTGGCGLMPPTAWASASEKTVGTGEDITLDASASYDPAGQTLTHRWSGEDLDSDASIVTVSYDTGGRRCFDLLVTDTENETDQDRICVDVRGPVAVADASPARVDPDESVTFDGSASYDPYGGTIVSYEWRDGGVLVASTAVFLTAFSMPGIHCHELVVTDSGGYTANDTACVSVNAPPVAIASVSAERVRAGTNVTFDAAGSHDPDGVEVWFQWGDGENIVSTEETYISSFGRGVHCLELTITDVDGLSSTDTACVTVHTDPIAKGDATPGEASVGYLFSFTGVESISYEGDLTYRWAEQGVEVGSGMVIGHAFSSTGTRCLTLTVTDAFAQTDTDEVCVEVIPPLRVVVSPSKQTYGLREDAYVNGRVQHPSTFAYLEDVNVTLTVTYESGDARIDEHLQSIGCVTRWEETRVTDAQGRVGWQVPGLAERCGGLDVGGQAPNTLSGRYVLHAAAVKDALYGEDSRSYRVWGV